MALATRRWRRQRRRHAFVTAGAIVGAACCLQGASAWGGAHPFGFQGSSTTGFAVDYGGGGFADGAKFGFHGSGGGRMYMVENWQAGDWPAASYRRFNLLGKTLRFTVDLSNVGCGVIACLYFSAMANPGPGSNYCDIYPGSGGCFELDLMEANSLAYEVSLHTHTGAAFDGTCNEKGCSTNVGRYPFTVERPHAQTKDLYGPGGYIDSHRPFQVVAAMDAAGALDVRLEQEGRILPVYNKTSAWNFPAVADPSQPDTYPKPGGISDADLAKVPPAMQQGLTLVTSLWTGADTRWLDMNGCGGQPHADINSAGFTISGMTLEDSPPQAIAPPTAKPAPAAAAASASAKPAPPAAAPAEPTTTAAAPREATAIVPRTTQPPARKPARVAAPAAPKPTPPPTQAAAPATPKPTPLPAQAAAGATPKPAPPPAQKASPAAPAKAAARAAPKPATAASPPPPPPAKAAAPAAPEPTAAAAAASAQPSAASQRPPAVNPTALAAAAAAGPLPVTGAVLPPPKPQPPAPPAPAEAAPVPAPPADPFARDSVLARLKEGLGDFEVHPSSAPSALAPAAAAPGASPPRACALLGAVLGLAALAALAVRGGGRAALAAGPGRGGAAAAALEELSDEDEALDQPLVANI